MARSGFVKKHATDLAYAMREELDLGPFDKLDPLLLADHLAIPVRPLSEIRDANPDADHFLKREKDAFSAVTIFAGTNRLIIHNDAHSTGRQASNICHELGHGLLLHDPSPALDQSGCRDWDQVMEDQAQWLSGALLVHEVALVVGLKRGRTYTEMARQFGVSDDMIAWRVNMTGARRRAR